MARFIVAGSTSVAFQVPVENGITVLFTEKGWKKTGGSRAMWRI